MKSVKLLVAMLAVFLIAAPTQANQIDELKQENQQLKNRVDNLENELAQIKQMLMSQNKPETEQSKTISFAQPCQGTCTAKTQLDQSTVDKLLKLADREERSCNPVLSDLNMELYGFLRLDTSYDSSEVKSIFGGSATAWVNPEGANKNDDKFDMTARVSRIGVKITAPEENGIKVSGVGEIDFCGSDTKENSNEPRMRHAFMKIEWPEEEFSILAGQYWDVINPLHTPMIDSGVAWWSGNIGYRRPQIRLTKLAHLNDDVSLKLEGAISRTVGTTFAGMGDTGSDSGQPTFQGRISSTLPLIDGRDATFGFSGHYGKEELDDITVPGDERDFDSWSLGCDLKLPINDRLTLSGEAFIGENLQAYLGGIAQGVNKTTEEEIRSKGGWLAMTYKPADKWLFNLGHAVDDVDSSDLTGGIGQNARELNQTSFVNCVYSLTSTTDIGLEIQHNRTEYKDDNNGNSTRAQLMYRYKF